MTPLRLFILGATGRTGHTLVEQAIQRGHRVTAFVRSPQKLGPLQKQAIVRQGEVRSVDELRGAMPEHDAVLSMLGSRGLGPTTLLGDGARATVAAMQATGIRRLLIVSVAMLFEDVGTVATVLRRTLFRNIAKDSAEMEHIVISSGLDWTIARPPRLTSGPLTRSYGVADDHLPYDASPSISRADVAHFLLQELEGNGHVHRVVGVATLKTAARRTLQARSPA